MRLSLFRTLLIVLALVVQAVASAPARALDRPDAVHCDRTETSAPGSGGATHDCQTCWSCAASVAGIEPDAGSWRRIETPPSKVAQSIQGGIPAQRRIGAAAQARAPPRIG